jgi:hypothetical protein
VEVLPAVGGGAASGGAAIAQNLFLLFFGLLNSYGQEGQTQHHGLGFVFCDYEKNHFFQPPNG